MSHAANIILEHIVLVKVEANIYGARKKLKKEDLVLADGSKLPPEDLANLGSKRLLDPEQLSVFNRLKKEAERICLRIGTRFLGGYAIPCEAAPDIIAELERIGLDFAAAKKEFLAGYDAAVTDWVVRHPEFGYIIEKAVDSVEFVSTRLSFDYLVVTVGLPDALPIEEVVRLENKIGSLSEQMFYEIALDANQFIEQSLIGKEQVTRNVVRPIKRMRDKLDGLGFLDYRVAPVVSTIDDLLSRIPTKGAIEGIILQEIFATAMLLADPDKTKRHGAGLLADHSLAIEPDESVDDASAVVLALPVLQPETIVSTEYNDQFSELFAGIFEEELESDECDLEIVTTEDDEDDKTGSDTDRWF
ncbi:DUF3150 domain-containing protein [Methylobacter svalbardensis]|uniref:DUF3150 domain-containing protein n=1 Tax=Methylobacter svalbardensis TaxID=3080016 RepID=UPI0030EC1384